jgi:hypothetical protein
VLRELAAPEDLGDGDVRTHEIRVVEPATGVPGFDDGAWMLMEAGPCVPRLVVAGDLGEADLTLATEPRPDATVLELLVLERACASGRTAEGRVELVELEETADEIRLRVGVRPQPGEQECPGHPPTPFTVELAEPLGDRRILDAAVVPPRELRVHGDAPYDTGP